MGINKKRLNKVCIMKKSVKNIIASSIFIYCTLSICRSLGLIYLAYSNEYFYNFDFKKDGYMSNIYTYYLFLNLVAYISGFIVSIILNFILKMKWVIYLIGFLLAIIIFVLFDSQYIRPLFGFFENARTNIFIHTIGFIIVAFLLFLFNRKRK